ncbi:MAG: hypothetical protein KKA84_11560 [Bacteroidetes bacterium]|nr:hypothetical protein [Bacteroidota bacterium]
MKKIVFIILTLVTSCDLLNTRDPEDPVIERSSYIVPVSPEILFQNLISSFEEKILENYISCFVDLNYIEKQYRFVPAAGSISQFAELANWSLEAERSYFNNLRTIPGENIPMLLSLYNERSEPIGDSAVYQFDYSLQIPVVDESGSNEYQGSVLFRIYRDSRQQWAIGEWEDIKIEGHISWSELKGRYY